VAIESDLLEVQGLQQFAALRSDAIDSVTARLYQEHSSVYAQFDAKGRDACREDLGYHLEFLRSVLEFGMVGPMVEYLRWLEGVLETRGIPTEHLPKSLDWLGEFFGARMDASAAKVVVAALSAVKSKFLEKTSSPPANYASMPSAWPDCAEFEAALLAGDRRTAAAMMERSLAQGRSLIETELHMIQPALYRIGDKWQSNQVSVVQEHLATAIAQSVMVQGLVKCKLAEPNGKKVLLACVEGNHHALGLQMVADAFELAGWEVNYIGANVPTASLVGHVGSWKPDLLGLSVSFPHQLPVVKEVIARLNKSLGARRPPVVIGGLAINKFQNLAHRIGADAWSADAAAAVVSGDRLVAA
jgi:methanogenic corrinoid protein MtbC1